MSDTAQDAKNQNIPEIPTELESLVALNTAIAAARASEADKRFVVAALKIKTLVDFE